MNDTLKAIRGRRSTRIYKPDQLPEDTLQAILEAGLYAPSAMNRQPWHITVVQDQALITAMNLDAKAAMADIGIEYLTRYAANEAYNIFYHAPTLLIVSGEAEAHYAVTDCAAVTENMLIAANSLGVGSCWIGMARFALEGDKKAHYRDLLNIPEGYEPQYTVVLGYPKNEPAAAPPRKVNAVNYIR